MNYKSGLVVFEDGIWLHSCLYGSEDPTDQIELLREELNTDEEFDLIGKGRLLEIRVMTHEEFDMTYQEFLRMLKRNCAGVR